MSEETELGELKARVEQLERELAAQKSAGHLFERLLESYALASGLLANAEEPQASSASTPQLLSDLAHVARLSTLGAMTSALTHELNQPLTAIATYARAGGLQLASGKANNADLKVTLERIARQAERAGELIRRLKRLISRRAAHSSTVDVNEPVREVLALVEPDLKLQRVNMTVSLANDLPFIAGDRVQIEQVVLNLMRNAIEAAAEVDVDRRTIEVITRHGAANGVEIVVRDSGRGIPPEMGDRLFGLFQTTKSSGMGLGLAISRVIAEAHHGQLRLESAADGRTTFVLLLPQRESAEAYGA